MYENWLRKLETMEESKHFKRGKNSTRIFGRKKENSNISDLYKNSVRLNEFLSELDVKTDIVIVDGDWMMRRKKVVAGVLQTLKHLEKHGPPHQQKSIMYERFLK
ncbi:hypothetical protein CEXT_195031 [Caerostris extrusa]|uniref:Uncharacterized protein n=1 Tax=Caerostris extrusa TaxID=172846 RepID=A0AAV4M7F6_CAEEX|nr:hypothetical protein CEXT_195031 [Caerostris extrusa]